ncbi:pyridoxine 5'-phosphate synthase [Maribellus comscasis]|uniref:Pyridoxine 5'-phosphate synthase n=1 Tax=Maribellus comscasis TaxID=2681766 RepID=A0A6I6JWI6_9BACT|nr:pyridoxine 5'-phosphate synthase [Maribellus comscasis]QGY45490.1 pyridoxine 5'-phosphate synthase [Maribellus comscasis]
MTRLSVNINKIATLRNSRGGAVPSVKDATTNCQKFGAQGITIHPRPDERHITRKDVYEIKPLITTEFNIEGYPSKEFLQMVIEVRADQVTLVPDTHYQLTSDHGWDTWKNLGFLQDVISELKENGIRTSIFVDANPSMIEGAAETKTDRIELYTEPYASLYPINRSKAIEPFVEAAKVADSLEIDVNAGHDLSLENLNYMFKHIPNLKEVSIGHALIADALYLGLETTIQKYLECLK